MTPEAGDITQLLAEARAGDRDAEARLLPLVYDQLKRLAASYMRRERADHTLQPTALVHEAYLQLAGIRDVAWQSRLHFFSVASQTMRRLLVDHARAHCAEKRGGKRQKISLDQVPVLTDEHCEEILDLDAALHRLAARDERLCRVVELRYFAGLSVEEVAAALEISVRTVKRDWSVARAWLHGELRGY